MLRLGFYQAANVARSHDPQLAEFYRRLIVHRGHTHTQTCVAVAGRLVHRTWTDLHRASRTRSATSMGARSRTALRSNSSKITTQWMNRPRRTLRATSVRRILRRHSSSRTGGAALRQHRGDASGQRSRTEDDAGEWRLLHASHQRALPAGVGLCFTYDINAAVGSRVTGAVRQAADGTCTGAPVDLTAATTYTILENDFMGNGGNGYPNFSSRMTTLDLMEVTANYIDASSPISPTIPRPHQLRK